MHNWDDFRFFHAVAVHGSYSVAAKVLEVTHSTVSRRIQALEEQHGVRLLDRTQQGYTLTEAGQAVFTVVEELHCHALKASRAMLGQDARLEGKVTLTMPHELFDSCMVKPLLHFHQQNTAINLNISVTHGLKNLANREADIALRITANPPDYLVGKCLTPLQHGLYDKEDRTPSQKTPIINWADHNRLPSWASEHFEQPYIALQVDDLASMYAAVNAGFGIARMPCFFPDSQLSQNVVRLPIYQPLSSWGIWLLSHTDLRNTARVTHCKKFLEATVNEIIPLFRGELSLQK